MITGVRIEHTSSNSVNFKNNTKYSCQGTSSVWKSTDFEFFMHFYSTKAIIFLHYVVISYFLLKRLKYVGTVTEKKAKKTPHLYSKSIILYVYFISKIFSGEGRIRKMSWEKRWHMYFLVNVYKRNIFIIAV